MFGRNMPFMPSALKIANVWRIISDVDLEAIRRQAMAPVDIWIVTSMRRTRLR